ncbi:ATP-binding protein [Pyrococcus abyssi]|uniref:Uncharacterized ATP-binding protein PYRAB06260 n=1 Tax=Pyrococcus abyssi (strain GE5 / Orsay) TaxID=272844 RepID=Y626_PYRAB|nr:ATP-binding protein [Pyrococcus abyssi]Q9V103.1 RecName: Full=Uncharacterized ATP-binding protein PYRAB06260 [Pyrococcus abyssi GE5]CAB49548.1 Archaeal ATPase [Pyrococcus abyssi GE5]CCE70020.1 TPA: atp-binding protein [Pyrococcus abyssi GE5]
MFFDREKELSKLLKIIESEPSLITFIYGPINSGKTALIQEFIRKMPDHYVAFYINLRATPITKYEDFIDILFSIEFENPIKNLKEALSLVISAGKEILGIPIPNDFLKQILSENKPKNAFLYITKLLTEVKRRGKRPILILDELQVIGDLRINGPLIYEIFNFFIHLTKEAHLSHVFTITSDSLFMERIYSEAMLQGRADYFLVDDFDEKTALNFLKSQGLTEEEANLALEYFGGKPPYLIEAIKHREELEDYCKKALAMRTRQVYSFAYGKRRIIKLLTEFKNKEEVPFTGKVTRTLEEAVKANILFVDPLNGIIKPQGRLELLAIREALRMLT